MKSLLLGQFVYLDGSGDGVVGMLPDGVNAADDHVGVWFGTTTDEGSPIVSSVPVEYLTSAPEPRIQH
ncbi:hypothetical protein [Neorhodopirellula pilleata]|uniref:Uncharacterized protein n=1 Tax=Neorhodopirellula pilleata TaxID=2714738 RepID=A0A5C6A4T7_9BACT|nr:hypothetical protein [Neorhodopirellula pilleata]TWT94924.1 hypothetical protein Pla100_34990 [Neorhodopirellula pilleata]